jgi:glycosyltransferase involved in cell wall biosynthesis
MSAPASGFPPDAAAGPRLLFVSSTLELGGAERHLATLVPALRARGFVPAVLTLRREGPFFHELARQGIAVRCAGMNSRFDLRGFGRALRAAGSWPDLVVTQGLDAEIVGAAIGRRAGAPHATIHHKQPEITLALHRRLLMRIASRTVDLVVAVTSVQVQDLVEHGFSENRIVVIPNGVRDLVPSAPRSVLRSRWGVEHEQFVALLVATLRPEKRADVFVESVGQAARRDPRIRGLVAGDGPERALVASRAGSAVTLLGARDDVVDLIEASDVVCLTSSAEALPMVVLEAMAGGRAVIATDVGGIASVVRHGSTGRVIPLEVGGMLADVLVELAAAPEAVSKMGLAGRAEYLEHYSADRMVDSYVTEFGKLLRR